MSSYGSMPAVIADGVAMLEETVLAGLYYEEGFLLARVCALRRACREIAKYIRREYWRLMLYTIGRLAHTRMALPRRVAIRQRNRRLRAFLRATFSLLGQAEQELTDCRRDIMYRTQDFSSI